jgi:hypothetical protein
MWCETHPNSIPFVSGPMYNYHISTKGYIMTTEDMIVVCEQAIEALEDVRAYLVNKGE